MKIKSNTKIFFKIIAFFLIFSIVFLYAQNILRWKGERAENLDIRYEDFIDDTKKGQELDVLYMGTSLTYAAVTPIVMWNECGFTGLNFGTSVQNSMSMYYLLQYVLKVQTPKVLVLDFCDLTLTRLPDDDAYWKAYKKAFDTIEDPKLKVDMLNEMNRKSTDFDWVEYLFPMFNYHARWTELDSSDFGNVSGYESYYKGALLNKKHKVVKKIGEYDESIEPGEISEFALEYYEKILDLCKEKGIEVFGVSFPRTTVEDTMSEYMAAKKYCEQKGIEYVDFTSPELFEKTGLDYSTDYYDSGHVNAYGSVKISKELAHILDEKFNLPDRRNDETYQEWNDGYQQFLTDFEPWFDELLK